MLLTTKSTDFPLSRPQDTWPLALHEGLCLLFPLLCSLEPQSHSVMHATPSITFMALCLQRLADSKLFLRLQLGITCSRKPSLISLKFYQVSISLQPFCPQAQTLVTVLPHCITKHVGVVGFLITVRSLSPLKDLWGQDGSVSMQWILFSK